MEIHTDEAVIGLCFHNEKPWILASLNSGTVMIYDYEKETEVFIALTPKLVGLSAV